jgi:hypothetical protein
MFKLTAEHLRQLCDLNSFTVDRKSMVFFALRGCLPANPGDHRQGREHSMELAPVDYLRPRCTIAQWLPATNTFAVFPGSTVPHRSLVGAAKRRGGVGANELLTGFYGDYRKGWHKKGRPTGHEAWRQTGSRPIRRTADDLDYDPHDRVEITNPADNLHCGWCAGVESEYSSAGCVVVVGFPKCAQRGKSPATGPWREFQESGYESKQVAFGLVLLNARDAHRLATAGSAGMERIRFGSSGEAAKAVQAALRKRDFYEGKLDGQFGPRSLRALLEFQEAEFGKGGDDGVCGPQTLAALGIERQA